MALADKLSNVLIAILVTAVFLGATVTLMFTNLAHIANNITAQGGVVGSLGVLFLILIPIMLVFGLFALVRKSIKM